MYALAPLETPPSSPALYTPSNSKWSIVRSNLRRIIQQHQALTNPVASFNWKQHTIHKPFVVRALSIFLLISLLGVTLFITAYNWQDWHYSGREMTLLLSDRLMLYRAAEAVNLVTLYLQEALIVVQHSSVLQSLDFADWADFSTDSLNRNVNLLYMHARFNYWYNWIPKLLTAVYFGTEGGCGGGNFLGLRCDGPVDPTDTLIEIIEPQNCTVYLVSPSTNCKYSSYRCGSDWTNRFSPSNFIEDVFDSYLVHSRPWYANGKQQNAVVWSPAYLSLSGRISVTATSPIYDTRADSSPLLRGIFGAEIALENITRYLASLRLEDSSVAYIVSINSGVLLGTSLVALHDRDTVLYAANSTNPLIRASASGMLERYGSWTKVPDFDDFRNLDTLTCVRNLYVGDIALHWILVVAVPTSTYLDYVDRNVSLFFYFGIPMYCVVVVSVVCVFIIAKTKNRKFLQQQLLKNEEERQCRALKLQQKRRNERNSHASCTSPPPHPPSSAVPAALEGCGAGVVEEDEAKWLAQALQEEKCKKTMPISDKMSLLQHVHTSSLVARAVVVVLLAVVVTNVTLWLVISGNNRHRANQITEDVLRVASSWFSSRFEFVLYNSFQATCRVRDFFVMSDTFVKDLQSLAPTASSIPIAIAPGMIPHSVVVFQKFLCHMRELYNVPNLFFIIPNSSIYIGCQKLNNTLYINAMDKFSGRAWVRYPAAADFTRGAIDLAAFSRHVIHEGGNPAQDDRWIQEALVDGTAGQALYPANDNNFDIPGAQLRLLTYWPIYSVDKDAFYNKRGLNIEAGIIASYTDLLPLVSLLSDDRLAGTANFVADIHGNLVMTPDGHVIQKPPEWAVTNIYKYIQLKVSESSVEAVSGLSYLFDNQMFLTGSYVDIHNTPLVMVSSFVKGWSNINWLIVLSIPQKIFFKEYFMNERAVILLTLLSSDVTCLRAIVKKHRVLPGDQDQEYAMESIYQRFKQMNLSLERCGEGAEVPLSASSGDLVRASEIDLAKHRAWLQYLDMAQRGVNVEAILALVHHYGSHSIQLQIYKMITHPVYRCVVGGVGVALCSLAFVEPSNWAVWVSPSSTNWSLAAAELTFVVFILADLGLKIWISYQLKKFHGLYCALHSCFAVCFLLDWVLFVGLGAPRWSRLLRPLFLLFRVSKLRMVTVLVTQSTIEAKFVILVFFYIIVLADLAATPLTVGVRQYELYGDFISTTFNNFYSSFVNIFVLLSSNLNFADCFQNTSGHMMVFWVLVIVAGTYLLLTILIGQFSNSYFVQAEARKHKARGFRRMAVCASFLLFDKEGRGTITRRDFTVFVATFLKQSFPSFDKMLRVHAASLTPAPASSPDPRREGTTVELSAFSSPSSLNLSELLVNPHLPPAISHVIQGCFHCIDASQSGRLDVAELEQALDLTTLCFVLFTKKNKTKHHAYLVAYLYLHVVSPLVLLVYVMGLAAYESILFSRYRQLDVVLSCLLLVFASEIIFKIGIIYKRNFKKYLFNEDIDKCFLNRSDVVLVGLSVVGALYSWIVALSDGSYQPFSGPHSFNRCYLVIAACRILTIHASCLRVVVIVTEIVPSCLSVVVLIACAFYIYASIGGVLLSGIAWVWPAVSFDSFAGSWVFMFWLFVGDSWNLPMTQAILQTSPGALWFFVSWFFVIKLLLLNLVLGIIIQRFVDYLVNPFFRIIPPIITAVRVNEELHQLRLLTDQVASWVKKHHRNSNVERVHRALSTVSFYGARRLSVASEGSGVEGEGLPGVTSSSLHALSMPELARLGRLVEEERERRGEMGTKEPSAWWDSGLANVALGGGDVVVTSNPLHAATREPPV